jgi:hypothetical protein
MEQDLVARKRFDIIHDYHLQAASDGSLCHWDQLRSRLVSGVRLLQFERFAASVLSAGLAHSPAVREAGLQSLLFRISYAGNTRGYRNQMRCQVSGYTRLEKATLPTFYICLRTSRAQICIQ